jgi:hypothetical protein
MPGKKGILFLIKIVTMKKIYSLLLFGMLISSNDSMGQQAADFNKLSWLEGDWIRTNTKAGTSGSEHWKKISATEWQGTGITMKGADTAFVEKLKLILKEGAIYYVADIPENKEPVLFRFSQLDESSFTCENASHDFPKKIEYRRTGNTLKAIISGNGKSIDYLFGKK